MEAFCGFQQRRPPNSAADFVENRIILPGGTEIHYNPATDDVEEYSDGPCGQELTKYWDAATEEREQLFQALEELQSEQKPRLGSDRVKLRKCTWLEVMEEISSAENRYRNAKTSTLRKCLRKIGENGDALQNWLQLLPDGDYGASISGAFRLLVKTATYTHNVKDCVFKALTDIPEIMKDASSYVQIYRFHPAQRLQEKTAGLFRAILTSLKLIVRYFGQKALVEATKTFFQGSTYNQDLVGCVSRVRLLAEEIRVEANRCQQERLCKMHVKLSFVMEKLNDMGKRGLSTPEAVAASLMRICQSNPAYDVRTGGLKILLPTEVAASGAESQLSFNSSRSTDSLPKVAEVAKKARVEPKTIMNILDFDPISPVSDAERCLELALVDDPIALDRASWVMHSEKLMAWLGQGKKSRALLIHGSSEPFQYTSPLSMFCGHLVGLFAAAKPILILNYFCGLHMGTDPRSNVSGMLVSLIGQLLGQGAHKGLHFELSFIDDDDIRSLEKNDIETLCNVFRDLVLQVPDNKFLICIIDGISLYETSDRRNELMYAWKRLNRLLTNQNVKVVLKLLATCPGHSLKLHDASVMKRGDILRVPDEVDGGRQGAWDTAELDESFNSSLM